MNYRALVLILAVATFFVAGCGGDDDDATPTLATASATPSSPAASSPAGAEGPDAVAAALLLKASDFPAGWAEYPYDESAPLDECEISGEERVATADSGLFVRTSGDNGYRNTIVVFANEEAAQSAIRGLATWTECMTGLIRDGTFDSGSARVVDVTSGPLSIPSHGDESVALQITVTVENTSGEQSAVVVEMVGFAAGTVASRIAALKFVTPSDTTLLATLAAGSEAKLAAAGHGD